jgi:protein-L-isoaspartate(D-aspartate) O-methyltransferase
MIEQQLRQRGIVLSPPLSGAVGASSSLLDAMFNIPRELFLPTRFFQHAYEDLAIPLGYQRYSYPPYVIAFMTEAAEVSPNDRVLDIGTGCGYPAAVLSRLVKNVFTLEPIEELYEEANDRFQDLGYHNVSSLYGDAQYGFPDYAPYNAIFVRDAHTEISPMLLQQLAINGRMIVPLRRLQQDLSIEKQPMDEEGVYFSAESPKEVLVRLTKVGDNMFIEETLMECDNNALEEGPGKYIGSSGSSRASAPRVFIL